MTEIFNFLLELPEKVNGTFFEPFTFYIFIIVCCFAFFKFIFFQ